MRTETLLTCLWRQARRLIGTTIRATRSLLAAGLMITLAACGGSGDDGGTPSPTPSPTAGASIGANTIRVHYKRTDNTYTGWAVYAFSGPVKPSTGWPGDPRYFFEKT
ncbi:MAG: pullulanase-associated domain-containing protein, partial [Burkholderiaceae bacterium]